MRTPIAPVADRRGYGIAILLFAQIFFTVLDSSAKWLAVTGIPTTEIIFMRYAVHTVLIVALFLPVHRWGLFRSGNWKLEVARGLCLLGTTVGNFYAMKFLPLTVTGSLMFTMPLMVCALSVPLLGEQVGWRRWAAILVGFAGMLIIIRPGTEAFHPAALLSLGAALCAAFYSIFTRKLAGVDSAATQQVFAGVVALCFVTPLAFEGWVWPADGPGWFALFAAGVAGMLAHLLITVAHRFAPPSTLAPFNYLQLVYLALASWVIFDQPPDLWFFIGAPIIIGSGLYIWLREVMLARETPPLFVAR